jgi:hypothetical protein
MKRYFFHTNHPATGTDIVGMEFAKLTDAKCQAARFAGQLLSNSAEHFWDDADLEMTVTDEKGLMLFALRVVGIEAPAIRGVPRPV